MMKWPYRLPLLCVTVGLLVFSGCRTYGGYGSGPKTYEALQSVVRSFENELDRAKADLRRLKKAAADADTLQAFVDKFHAYIKEHKSLLEKQRRRVDRLSADANYRNLHQAYSATLTEQRLMRQKYQRTIKNVRRALHGPIEGRDSSRREKRSYTVKPIGFPDLRSRDKLTMEEALRGR